MRCRISVSNFRPRAASPRCCRAKKRPLACRPATKDDITGNAGQVDGGKVARRSARTRWVTERIASAAGPESDDEIQARIGFGCGRSNAPGKPEEKNRGWTAFSR